MPNLIVNLLAVLLLGLSSTSIYAETQIIELRHRSAAELLPKIEVLLAPHERATEWGQQLIINASTGKIRQINELIEQLDTPAKRLLISVDHGHSRIGNQQHTQVRSYSTTGTSDQRSIQTLEGSPALIQTGQQIQQNHWAMNQHGQPQQQISQRNLAQGFYVVASIQGDRVTLELREQHDSLDSRNIVQQQNLVTRVNGPLNQWIEVGNLQQQQQDSTQNHKNSSRRYSNKNNSIRIKVELLD